MTNKDKNKKITTSQQRAELHKKIWKIADDVRGSIDAWDFKQYILITLFYRFISEYFTHFIESRSAGRNYATMSNDEINARTIERIVKANGFFIYPSDLFVNVVKNAHTNINLNTDLEDIFTRIENSAKGYESEEDIKGLFEDFDTTNSRLGNTVIEKNNRLTKILQGIAEIDFGNLNDNQIDIFGDAYEFIIGKYAANAGKSGGEYFTPPKVSELLTKLAMHNKTKINKVYDPACGSGSLLLQAKKHIGMDKIENGFFGQEINPTTYNLARMNMFLHGVNYAKFSIYKGDTLMDPHYHNKNKPFDVIVSNPPYSVKWKGDDDPTLIEDDRFSPAGVLAPKDKADLAFVMHTLNYLSPKGRAAIVCFPGIFNRRGKEQKIREYLVKNNFVETIISLPENLFYGTNISTCIMILAKNKKDTKIQFIDASGEDFFKKVTNNNELTDSHVNKIVKLFADKKDIDYIAKNATQETVKNNDYNLSVNKYVETKDTREVINITKLNENIANIVAKNDQLRIETSA